MALCEAGKNFHSAAVASPPSVHMPVFGESDPVQSIFKKEATTRAWITKHTTNRISVYYIYQCFISFFCFYPVSPLHGSPFHFGLLTRIGNIKLHFMERIQKWLFNSTACDARSQDAQVLNFSCHTAPKPKACPAGEGPVSFYQAVLSRAPWIQVWLQETAAVSLFLFFSYGVFVYFCGYFGERNVKVKACTSISIFIHHDVTSKSSTNNFTNCGKQKLRQSTN